jgi:hypothetical protein
MCTQYKLLVTYRHFGQHIGPTVQVQNSADKVIDSVFRASEGI